MDDDLDAAHIYLSFSLLLCMGRAWSEVIGLIVTAYHYWWVTRARRVAPKIESLP